MPRHDSERHTRDGTGRTFGSLMSPHDDRSSTIMKTSAGDPCFGKAIWHLLIMAFGLTDCQDCFCARYSAGLSRERHCGMGPFVAWSLVASWTGLTSVEEAIVRALNGSKLRNRRHLQGRSDSIAQAALDANMQASLSGGLGDFRK